MAKKKEAPDAFGLSLLDVLSNALGGLIILMLIVAVTKKGNDERRLNQPDEGREGKIYTDTKFDTTKMKIDNEILIVQLRVFGKGELKLDLKQDKFSHCSLSKFSDNDTLKPSNNWMIVRMGEQNAKWTVNVVGSDKVDSVAVFVTKNAKVFCSNIVIIDNNGAPLIAVEDKGKQQSIIKIGGIKSCP